MFLQAAGRIRRVSEEKQMLCALQGKATAHRLRDLGQRGSQEKCLVQLVDCQISWRNIRRFDKVEEHPLVTGFVTQC